MISDADMTGFDQATTAAAFARRIASVPMKPHLGQVRKLVLKARALAGLSQSQIDGLDKVRAFTERVGNLGFFGVGRDEVAYGLIARVLDAGTVNQADFGLCGPAAYAINAAEQRPNEYADFAISVAETGRGQIGGDDVIVHPDVLYYDPGSKIPPIDWIVLASVRNDPGCVQNSLKKETYGGSTGDELFDWLRNCGYQRLVLISHITLANRIRCQPLNLIPLTMGTKESSLKLAAKLSGDGWQVFMQAYMSLSKGIESAAQAESTRVETEAIAGKAAADAAHDRAMTKVQERLSVANPGIFGTLKAVAVGSDADHTRHWTYVHSLAVHGDVVNVTCSNHGKRFVNVHVPLDGFCNKFLGFIAASDLPW